MVLILFGLFCIKTSSIKNNEPTFTLEEFRCCTSLSVKIGSMDNLLLLFLRHYFFALFVHVKGLDKI